MPQFWTWKELEAYICPNKISATAKIPLTAASVTYLNLDKWKMMYTRSAGGNTFGGTEIILAISSKLYMLQSFGICEKFTIIFAFCSHLFQLYNK